MSVLSEQEIKKELGVGISIYPFHRKNSLRGCCLALTASKYVYSINQQKILDVHTDVSNTNIKYVEIAAHEIVLALTNESVALDNRFCGSIHSTVGLVSQGIGHIGTRVNPNWSGILLIALHNVSDKKIRINIAEHESQLSTLEAIAYLRFHELTSKSSTQPDVGDGGRLDIIAKHPNTQKMIDWIRDPGNKWRRNKDDLKQILKDSDEYKQVKQELKEKSLNHLIDSRLRDFAPSLVVTALILIYILLENKQNIEDLILVLIPLVYTIVFEMFRRKG